MKHIIFDFFGTLAAYEADVGDADYPLSRRILQDGGVDLGPGEFRNLWQSLFKSLDAAASTTLEEFSMRDVTLALVDATGAANLDHDAFIDAYIAEWGAHVAVLPGLRRWLFDLPHAKSILSNTHDRGLVPGLLEQVGLSDAFDAITLSVDHGRRKPDRTIFDAHLARIDCDVQDVVYVGDDPECDFQGPSRLGMDAYLISPTAVGGVPETQRIMSLWDLAEKLAPTDR